jgi:hypothetical protein
MVKLNVTMDNDILLQLQMALARFGEGSMPGASMAMRQSAGFVRETWKGFAIGYGSGKYARSIKIDRKGPFDYEIYSEDEIADWYENGTKDLDMKTTHPYGPRSRVSKKGVPFLIIPIRWGTPGTVGFRNVMPEQVYNIIKNFTKMKKLVGADQSDKQSMNAHRMLPNGRAGENGIDHTEMVGRAQYNKGYDRLNGMDFAGTIEDKSRMDGMVRTTDETGKDRSGGYLTFRVISAKSPENSWKRKGWPVRHVSRLVVEDTKERVNSDIEAAIREDLGL